MAGRPNTGMNYDRITLRIGEDHSDIIRQYCRDHHIQKDSEAVRAAIGYLGIGMLLSDKIEVCVNNLAHIWEQAKDIDAIPESWVEALAAAVRTFDKLSYVNTLPNDEQLAAIEAKELRKHKKYLKEAAILSEQARQAKRDGKNNVGHNTTRKSKADTGGE